MNKIGLGVVLAVMCLPLTLGSQVRAERLQLKIGADASVYWPTSSKTRNALGSSWVSVGLGLSAIRVASERGSVSPEMQFIAHNENGNKAFFGYLGVAYRKAISSTHSRLVPYAGASAGLGLVSIEVPSQSVDSGTEFRPAGSIFTGVTLTEHAFAELRYSLTTKVNGYDLSGLQARVGYRF